MQPLIDARSLVKTYMRGDTEIPVLRGVDFSVQSGEWVAVMGPSGSGKSTLMHILGCLGRPTSGQYIFDGVDIRWASDRELASVRADAIGFVFQTFNLLPDLSIVENVEVPFLYSSGSKGKDPHGRVLEALEHVGLQHRLTHRPGELSGGEMQRVAIARAMVMGPKLILADEPTGNLDSRTGKDILSLFRGVHKAGVTVIMVTHDREVAAHAGRTVVLKDGEVVQAD